MQVKVSAEVSSFTRDMQRARREVEEFSRPVGRMGQSLAQTSRFAGEAAGAISGLSMVMPGLSQGTATAVRNLTGFSFALGETTVAVAHAREAWALLKVGITSVIESGVLATFGAIAAAGAATAVVVGSIAKQFSDLGSAISRVKRTDFGHVVKIENLDPRIMDPRKMTGAQAHTLGAVTVNDTGAPLGGANFKVAEALSKSAVTAWEQAATRLRPITTDVVQQWNNAMAAVQAAMANTKGMTDAEVNSLYAMKQALKEVQQFGPSAAAGGIRPDIIPQKMFGFGLDPRKFLGSKMDATPKSLGLDTDKGSGFLDFAGGWLAKGFGTAITGAITGGIGAMLFAPVSSMIGRLFGRPVRDSSEALSKLASAADRVTQSISNIPTGFRLARYVYGAASPVMAGAGAARSYGGGVMHFSGNITVVASNPNEFMRQIGSYAENTMARGGVSAFASSVAKAAA